MTDEHVRKAMPDMIVKRISRIRERLPFLRSFRGWSRGAKVALASGLAVAVFALAFDWNWFRPTLERHLSTKSHRSVRIDDFQVNLSWALDLTFRLRGVRIENAPWADRRPFIVARELTATCTFASLIHERPVITRLMLVDADVDLERRADGLRNWRLTRPEDRGPGIVSVLALEAVRSRIRFVHRGIDLDVQTAAVPLDAPVTAESPLTTRIGFEGTYRGAAFSGEALTGNEVTFLRTGRFFSIRGHAKSGTTRLDVDGRAADIFDPLGIDAQVGLHGPTLAQLRPFVGALPESPSYKGVAHLEKDLARFSFSGVIVRIGSTDVTGALTFDTAKDRHIVRAALRSELMHLDDLGWVRQIKSPLWLAAPRSLQMPEAMSSRIRDFDAELRLEVKHLKTAVLPMSANLALTARLAEGLLTIAPIDLGVAGGHATGELTLDAGKDQPGALARIEVRDVRIEKMMTALPDKKRVTGAIDGSIDLTARGDSMAGLLGSASGSIGARLVGGAMSRRLDAELGLSGTRLLRAVIGGDEMVPIKCAAAHFEFREGRGRARTLLIDTEQTSVEGTGTFDLRSGAIDLFLTPRSKHPGLLVLHKSISVRGTPGHIVFSLAAATRTSGRECSERKR